VYNCFGLQTEDLARAGAPPYTVVYNVDSLELIDYSFIAEYFGVYQVTFTDQCNSSGTSTIFVDQCDTKIPNVMTPNGDGKNDTFQISGIEGFRGSSLKVFDRWGKLVFEDDDYKNNWDGKDNADGTYFFIFTRSDGKVTTGHFDRIGGK
jgi:gliding motility-associated-like protein